MAKLVRRQGRRAVAVKGGQVLVRMPAPLLAALDAFIAEHDEHPSRSEAVRLILADALTTYGLLPVDEPPPMKRDAN